MIKFEHTEVMNFETAIRGMRNPLNSWEKSESLHCTDNESECKNCGYGKENSIPCPLGSPIVIGSNDMGLMKRLINAGTDHRKFLRQIIVSVDITAPLYWWKEFDTYKVGTVANSCSTMHKIHAKPFELEDFSHEHLREGNKHWLFATIQVLNDERNHFLETKDKKWWWQMIQLLPSSYNQKRTVTLNYEVLRNIATSRKNHKLDEWSIGFMDWIKSLPYAEDLILSKNEEKFMIKLP